MAFKQRLAAQAALASLDEARFNKESLGAYPPVHVETGVASRPDVSGGEDLTLFVPVDVFGRVSAARKQGLADMAVARAAYRQSLLDIQGEVLSAYVELVSAQQLVLASQESFELAQRLRKAADVQLEARAIPEIQRSRSDFELKRAEQTLKDRNAAVQAALRRFEAATGTIVESAQTLTFDDLASIPLKGDEGLKQRPDLLALSSNIDRANAERRAALLLQAPSMEMQFRRSPWSSDQEQYGPRLQFFVPIWDDGASKSAYRAANSRRVAAELELRDRTLSAQKELLAARIEFSAARDSVRSYGELIQQATEMLNKIQRGFELGGATLLDVIDARRAYNDTQEQAVAARQRLATAGAALLKARGEILGEMKS